MKIKVSKNSYNRMIKKKRYTYFQSTVRFISRFVDNKRQLYKINIFTALFTFLSTTKTKDNHSYARKKLFIETLFLSH